MAVKVIFGCGNVTSQGAYDTVEKRQQLFSLLKQEGVPYLDTARLYEDSEIVLGSTPGHESFTIDTKLPLGFLPGASTKEAVIRDVQESFERFKIPQFDVLYLHAPDDSVPIENTLEGVNEAYKKGQFKRLGLSNFTATQVQQVYDIAEKKGYVRPSVYQGNYSPIARHLETLLLPTLRRLNIAFFAYSPLAGGFLTKTPADLDAGAGRFNQESFHGLYNTLYNKPQLRDALGEWNAIAEKEGISKAELAYRWVSHNSLLDEKLGDAVVFGASHLRQIEQTVRGIKKGGLSEESTKNIDALWSKVKEHAPIDNFWR